MENILTAVIILIIVGAIIAVEMKDLLSAIIGAGIAGYGLSIIFLLLGAPDLAITQIVAEILALIILVSVTLKRDTSRMTGIRAVALALVAVFSIGSFLYFSALSLVQLPSFGFPHMRVSGHYVETALKNTGAANIVTSVILDWRALDTLGEATVLFTAAVGVVAIMRKTGKKKIEEKD